MPYQYPGEEAVAKIFVLICHDGNHALCMKATSQISMYANNADQMKGVVYFAAMELPFFPVDTAVQPDNPHPITHIDISRCQANGSFKLLGNMPKDFPERLMSAIANSITMKPARKQHWISRL